MWRNWWDPSEYLPAVRCPMLWVNGTNDPGFSMPSVVHSSRLTTGDRTLSLRYRLPHGHREGWAPREIAVFAEAHFLGAPGLPRITEQRTQAGKIVISLKSDVPLASAELFHTTDTGHWRKREWLRTPIPAQGRIGDLSVVTPDNATVCFVNLVDERKLIVSSDLF